MGVVAEYNILSEEEGPCPMTRPVDFGGIGIIEQAVAGHVNVALMEKLLEYLFHSPQPRSENSWTCLVMKWTVYFSFENFSSHALFDMLR